MFDKNNFEFLGSIPDSNLDGIYVGITEMNGNRGNVFTRTVAQVSMIFNNLGSEGGLFLVLGKKK